MKRREPVDVGSQNSSKFVNRAHTATRISSASWWICDPQAPRHHSGAKHDVRRHVHPPQEQGRGPAVRTVAFETDKMRAKSSERGFGRGCAAASACYERAKPMVDGSRGAERCSCSTRARDATTRLHPMGTA